MTCYSSTVQVILPRRLNSTASSITPTLTMSISHHQQWCQCAPEAMGLCKHCWTNTETLKVFHPPAKPWIILMLFIIPYKCSRGMEGGRMLYSLGAELSVPGSPWVYPASATLPLAPGSQAGTWWLWCYTTARSHTVQTLLLSPRESPALLFSQSSHQLPIKARGLSSGFIALL